MKYFKNIKLLSICSLIILGLLASNSYANDGACIEPIYPWTDGAFNSIEEAKTVCPNLCAEEGEDRYWGNEWINDHTNHCIDGTCNSVPIVRCICCRKPL